MMLQGFIKKLTTNLQDTVIYSLPLNDKLINLNELIGKKTTVRYLKEIRCIKCGRNIKKTFMQGYCYPCFINAPETEECVIRPELCRAHEGIARDMNYARTHCLIDHYVYLAITSNVKVGVTRSTHIPNRWIDQGAVKAIKIARTPNRYLSGLIETSLKKHFSDKTNWRNMLTNKIDANVDLLDAKIKAIASLPFELQEYAETDNNIVNINYPVNSYPEKVKSINIENQLEYTGQINGIKGQYLIFSDGDVINIWKYSGYKIQIEY